MGLGSKSSLKALCEKHAEEFKLIFNRDAEEKAEESVSGRLWSGESAIEIDNLLRPLHYAQKLSNLEHNMKNVGYRKFDPVERRPCQVLPRFPLEMIHQESERLCINVNVQLNISAKLSQVEA